MIRRKEVVKTETNDGAELVLAVLRPTYKIENDSEVIRGSVWNKMRQSLPLRDSLLQDMISNGTWSEQDRAKEKYLIDQIDSGVLKLARGGVKLWGLPNPDENSEKIKITIEDVTFEVDSRVDGTGQAIAIQIVKDRVELRSLRSKLTNLLQNSAEAYAETEKFNYLLANCVIYNENNKKYFVNEFNQVDVDVYISKENEKASQDVTAAFIKLYYGDIVEAQKEMPEWKFLIRHKMANEKLQLLDKSGQLIGFDGRRIDEEGYYVNEDGHRIDRHGNLLDEKGELKIESMPFLDDDGLPLAAETTN